MINHDHSGEPMVWCETHQHKHIARIPRITFACKSCGFGSWKKPTALDHAAALPDHEIFEEEHVTRPLPAGDLREELLSGVDEFLFNYLNWPPKLQPHVLGVRVDGFRDSLVESLAPAIMAQNHPFTYTAPDMDWMVHAAEESLEQRVKWYGVSYFDETARLWIRVTTLHADGSFEDICWIHIYRDGSAECISDREMQMRQVSRNVQ